MLMVGISEVIAGAAAQYVPLSSWVGISAESKAHSVYSCS